jgi:hypothetical protein
VCVRPAICVPVSSPDIFTVDTNSSDPMNTGSCDAGCSCSCGGGRILNGDEHSQTRTRLNRLKLHAHQLKHRGTGTAFHEAMKQLSIEEAGTICEIVKRLNVLSTSSEIADREAVSGDGGVVYASGAEFWNAMTSTPENQRVYFMALGVRRGIVFFDTTGNLRLRTGPCSGMAIRPVTETTTTGAPNVAMCGSCKAFIPLSDAVICSNCKNSVHCRSCCASGMDGHDCTGIQSCVNEKTTPSLHWNGKVHTPSVGCCIFADVPVDGRVEHLPHGT